MALLVAVLTLLSLAAPAFAGHSSTGRLDFYPCTRCHPLTMGSDGKPTRPLPNGFKKHEIALEVHDVLGKGETACLACHDSPTRNPGKLKAPDGTIVDVTGDVSRVCERCHFEKYREWLAGIHGKHDPKCTSSGCHDAHTPSWIYMSAMQPFQGTGVEVRAVAVRAPFKPLASPPEPAPVTTPMWLIVAASLGAITCTATVGLLVVSRSKR